MAVKDEYNGAMLFLAPDVSSHMSGGKSNHLIRENLPVTESKGLELSVCQERL